MITGKMLKIPNMSSGISLHVSDFRMVKLLEDDFLYVFDKTNKALVQGYLTFVFYLILGFSNGPFKQYSLAKA